MSELIGTKVTVPGSTRCIGTIRYIGPIGTKIGIFAGIELQGIHASTRGKNSGSVDGVQYFTVSQPMSGLFMLWERLRVANIRLPELPELTSAMASPLLDLPNTPSPNDRQMSRGSSRLSSRESGRQSVDSRRVLREDSINLPKRTVKGVAGSRRALGDLFDATRRLPDQEVAHLRAEIAKLRGVIAQNALDLQEKKVVLFNLQSTVEELQPLLEESERRLDEKERKMAKQRADHDKAREEWRESLNLMMADQHETETFYEQKIAELESIIKRSLSEDIERYERELAARDERITFLETQATDNVLLQMANLSLEPQKRLEELEAEVRENKETITRLKELLNKLEEEHQRTIAEYETNSSGNDQIRLLQKTIEEHLGALENQTRLIEELQQTVEAQQETIAEQSRIIDEQENRIKGQDEQAEGLQTTPEIVDDSSKTDFESRIKDLEHQLAMRPTFEELLELQEVVEKAEELHTAALERKLNENTKLKEEVANLQQEASENEALRRELANLESKVSENEGLKKEIANLENKLAVSLASAPLNTPVSTLESAQTNDLEVYVPVAPVDPSHGREKWCGLCERAGHNSLNCPYENDIF